jgi:Ca2+-binding EF-hand superfamily protein
MDGDGNGTIDRSELKRYLQNVGEKLSDSEVLE